MRKLFAFLLISFAPNVIVICLMNPRVKFIQVVIIQNFSRLFLGYFITDEID